MIYVWDIYCYLVIVNDGTVVPYLSDKRSFILHPGFLSISITANVYSIEL